jgi:hypothetical protein
MTSGQGGGGPRGGVPSKTAPIGGGAHPEPPNLKQNVVTKQIGKMTDGPEEGRVSWSYESVNGLEVSGGGMVNGGLVLRGLLGG